MAATLMVGIRAAEERLAAIGRALQSAYETEVREATFARDAAAQSLARAQAMETAARSLGQTEILAKIGEIVASLRASESQAAQRLSELHSLENELQRQLSAKERTPGPAALPAPPISVAPPPPSMASMPATTQSPMSGGTMSPGTLTPSMTATPGPGTSPVSRDELLSRQDQLLARIDELDRVARRWPKDVARLGIQEHVALARLIGRRFETASRAADSRIPTALERLMTLAASVGAEGIVGLDPAEAGDWPRVAADARTQRLAIVEARKRSSAAA